MNEQIRIALPKGRLLSETASLISEAGWGLNDYNEETRLYHLKSDRYPNLVAKIFHEKDIPVQVSIGNYDLGICGLDWIEELFAKFPGSSMKKVKDLGFGDGSLVMATSPDCFRTINGIHSGLEPVRIASEYPNMAERFAAQNRLRRFNIFPLWGAAEAYPPEDAELALVTENKGIADNLIPLARVLEYSAYLIANERSWENKNMSQILASLKGKSKQLFNKRVEFPVDISIDKSHSYRRDENLVRIALPDGHQQTPTIKLLAGAGITLDGYTSSGSNYRPTGNLPDINYKVIRPQDMPLQVANGNFDLAVTGKDWVRNHLYQFPSSPVVELLDLKYGWVRIVAAVSNDLGIDNIAGLRQYCKRRTSPVRVASEYTNIADKFARDNHLGMYRVIPTWGATESFLPDDADLLIENTETGRTLARHNLKIIDTLFESTGCLIGRNDTNINKNKQAIISDIVTRLNTALEAK